MPSRCGSHGNLWSRHIDLVVQDFHIGWARNWELNLWDKQMWNHQWPYSWPEEVFYWCGRRRSRIEHIQGTSQREPLLSNSLKTMSMMLLHSGERLRDQNWTEWFQQKEVKVLEQPSQSPDLNPIENLWNHLKLCIHKRSPHSTRELFEFCQEKWQNISHSCCSKLVEVYSGTRIELSSIEVNEAADQVLILTDVGCQYFCKSHFV